MAILRRFITPVFLHAGIIHILLNMLAQLTASAEVCNGVDPATSRLTAIHRSKEKWVQADSFYFTSPLEYLETF